MQGMHDARHAWCMQAEYKYDAVFRLDMKRYELLTQAYQFGYHHKLACNNIVFFKFISKIDIMCIFL